MARIAACWTCSGAGKSGWPMQKLMMSFPWRARAVTSASTTKAFSVPREAARRLISAMGGCEKVLIMPPHAEPYLTMLINCAAYQEGRKLADIEKGQISEY